MMSDNPDPAATGQVMFCEQSGWRGDHNTSTSTSREIEPLEAASGQVIFSAMPHYLRPNA